MKKVILILGLFLISGAYAGTLSPELEQKLARLEKEKRTKLISIQISLKNNQSQNVISQAKALDIQVTPIKFMPGIMVGKSPTNRALLTQLAANDQISTISLPSTSYEELEVSTASMLLKQGDGLSMPISNWWDAGIMGSKAVIGLLDSGLADNYTNENGQSFERHEGLKNKNFYVNRGPESGFDYYLNGVRTAHGTGVGCIYGNEQSQRQGVAFGSKDFLITLAGDNEVDDTDWSLTLKNLDWLLLDPSHPKPNVINYSFGNGDIYCPTCENQNDWTPVAQTVDYIINHYQVTWVKSAGNSGWIAFSAQPYASTLSIPADSYNAIVVANMNNTLSKTSNSLVKTADRNLHAIQPSSSRGPTLLGRRKPDLTAPGNDTRTCTPDPEIYAVTSNPTFKPYAASVQYDSASKTRLVGGTSMATPHIGGAAALLYDSGITSPKAIKALLINSADTWTDNDQPGPEDKTACQSDLPNCGHRKIEGSHWNRTYGWGYINLNTAYVQKNYVYEDRLTPRKAICYAVYARPNDKITVAWEQRFDESGKPYQFTSIQMELFTAKDKTLIDADYSRIDNVLQVANSPREGNNVEKYPSQKVIVKLSIPKDIKKLEGTIGESFAIVGPAAMRKEFVCPASD